MAHIKTLQQKHDFMFSKGMNAYRFTRAEPSEEMKSIWEEKERLIKQILEITKGGKNDYCFLSPEELLDVLNKLKAEHAV